MKKRIPLNKRLNTIIFFLLFFAPFYLVFAQTMQSTSYKIPSDTINIGGVESSSPSYLINDTLGEVGTGDSNSTNYYMKAGFWQMQESYIALSIPDDLALTPIGGIEGAMSEGTMTWSVITDNSAGYALNIKTTSTPALKSSNDSFDDYTPVGANPDYNFSILSTTSAFGFSPEGVDVDSRFKDNSIACNIGTNETSAKCWDGLPLSPKIISNRTTSNHQTGSNTTVRFRAESGSNHIQTEGSYSAPIVVTAVTL